ncbi:MAG: glycosyltransferase family 4 protein, partial [Thermodesulfobacteriota bacterium]
MKILYITSQRPDSTGSGFYITEIIKEAADSGHECFLVAGITENSIPCTAHLPDGNTSFVHFESKDLPFPIPGMSDVMPYESTCFSDMEEREIEKYLKIFKKVISKAAKDFKPDVI